MHPEKPKRSARKSLITGALGGRNHQIRVLRAGYPDNRGPVRSAVLVKPG